jgi:outer membrane protein assembly factor BamD
MRTPLRPGALRPWILLVTLALSACAKRGPAVKYESPAEEDYVKGKEELDDRNFPEAQKLLERVRTKYPYSKYAALADLRLADLKYGQQKYVEAADAYQAFVKFHPNHPDVEYAAFRNALSRWKDGPSDFFLFPPVHERDLAQVAQAADALAKFVEKYPDTPYTAEAKELLAKARGTLSDRDWYAYEFYKKREKWQGAAWRLERIVKEYPGSWREPEVLYELAGTYLKMSERFRAQQALQQLVVRHPESRWRPEAEKLLAQLRSEPEAPPAPKW